MDMEEVRLKRGRENREIVSSHGVSLTSACPTSTLQQQQHFVASRVLDASTFPLHPEHHYAATFLILSSRKVRLVLGFRSLYLPMFQQVS